MEMSEEEECEIDEGGSKWEEVRRRKGKKSKREKENKA